MNADGATEAGGGSAGQFGVPQGTASGTGGLPGRPGTPDVATSAQPLLNADTLMLRGTFIRCVLETRIISDIPGFTSCVVTEPVYSFTGRRLLLPKGSKVLGKYDSGPTGDREAVIWDRVVTPNGVDVNMASPGIDNLGGTGHPGYLNSHWGSRIGSALLISILSDAFKYEGEKHGPQSTNISDGGVVTQSPYQSNTAQTLQDLSSQAVQASANRKPTLTINQGTVVSIYVAKDVDFSGVVARL
jgi:type IV secretion system protein VirB10